jgi:2-dehydropantoate 2-reductase
MHEILAVAQAEGVMLEQDTVGEALEFVDNAEANIKTSMQRDIESGYPSELDSLIGVIGRKGRARGVSTPAANLVYAALVPVDRKNAAR